MTNRYTIQLSRGKLTFLPEQISKEGDSIGVVHRHETSSTDELGRCHPERVDVLQGSPFMQQRMRAITKRNRGVNARQVMKELEVYMTGWLNYFGIASLKQRLKQWDEWLRHRIRVYIWKQWKRPKTKLKNLMKLGVPEYYARMAANSRRGYWFTAGTGAVEMAITNERLIRAGYFVLSAAYESIQSAYIGRAVYRTVRTVR